MMSLCAEHDLEACVCNQDQSRHTEVLSFAVAVKPCLGLGDGCRCWDIEEMVPGVTRRAGRRAPEVWRSDGIVHGHTHRWRDPVVRERCKQGLCMCCAHRPGRQRFEVYVCTAAERGYALEAWRHLDPNALLIPMAQRQQRFVCVPSGRLKDIADVIGLPGHPWLSIPIGYHSPDSAMPLAIVIDDRIDVRPLRPWDYPCVPPVTLILKQILCRLGPACVAAVLFCLEMIALCCGTCGSSVQ